MIRQFPIALYSRFFILNVVCGSLIDSNSQNISAISSLKDSIRKFVLTGRGCKLKRYVHVQGGGGIDLQHLSVRTS